MVIDRWLSVLAARKADLFQRFLPLMLLASCLGVLLPNVTQSHQIITHEVLSNYQSERTQIQVLLPETLDPARSRVVYVLPVGAHLSEQREYGHVLLELQRLGLHNKNNVIFVKPTFSATPWYGDHAWDPAIRQESHVLNVVLPFVDTTYSTATTPDARHLLGFSKSGWGAWSLLLRHPDLFSRALAWDSPVMLDRVGPWETSRIFGTQENFEAYKLSNLVRTRGAKLGPGTRLILMGHGVFRQHNASMAELLGTLHIPHQYEDGPRRKHAWVSGWLADAVDLLVSPRAI
jgi:enterochelin esterase-like enzyme